MVTPMKQCMTKVEMSIVCMGYHVKKEFIVCLFSPSQHSLLMVCESFLGFIDILDSIMLVIKMLSGGR